VEWIRALDESVKHRGPDGRGVLVDRVFRPADEAGNSVAGWLDVALIHRRLAIIDIEGGAQPMVDPPVPGGLRGEAELTPLADDALAVVFNGCIYNHRALRAELIAGGATFSTDHSDTEVLLHGYRAWGEKLPERLEGMFAFVIWDRGRGEWFAARDAVGEKPLFCDMKLRKHDTVWMAASTESACAVLRSKLGAPEHADLFSYISFGVSRREGSVGLRTPPGLTRRLDSSCRERVWKRHVVDTGEREFPIRSGARRLDASALDALIGQAVRDRLEADVPLACFLSGGVDSSLVAAHAREYRPDLRTFCVRMPDSRYDESPWAAAVARELSVHHTTLDCDPQPLDDLQRLIAHIGRPFGDSSLLPTYWLCKSVASHARVALSGDGGDELFGGYERYAAALWPEELKLALAHIPITLLDERNPKSVRSKLARLVRACRHSGYSELLRLFPGELGDELFDMPDWGDEPDGGHWPTDPLFDDFETSLPSDMLRKVDAASMAAGLEVRAPLLASQVIQAAFDTPLDVLMPPTPFGGRRLKGLLKDALRLHLPDRLIDRPKSGFAIPIGEWFRWDYGGLRTAICDVLDSTDPWPSVTAECPLNLAFCRRILAEHLSERRDHGQRLYALLVLHIWDRWLRSVRNP
jgi:asparagine synthase (glutamine-hydrolysing)